MDLNRRPFVASLLSFAWILFAGRTAPVASAGHPRRACQVDVQADRMVAGRIGRFLLQHANASTTTNTTNATGGNRKLPVVSIVIGSVAAAIAFLFLVLTTIGYFQNRWAGKVADSKRHHDDGPASSTSSVKIAPASNIGELES